MAKVVDVPGIGTTEFPDEMNDDDISRTIRLHLPEPSTKGTPEWATWRNQRVQDLNNHPAPVEDKGFFHGLWQNLNPFPAAAAVGKAVMHDAMDPLHAHETGDIASNVIGAQVNQGKKSIQAIKGEGEFEGMSPLERASSAVGHGLAAAVPLVGPAAAEAGTDIGEGRTAEGLGKATGLLAGVAGPSAINGIAKTGLGRAVVEPIADSLRTSAEQEYSRALNATTRGNKARSAAIVPELIKRGVMAPTLKGLGEKAAGNVQAVGEAIGNAWENLPEDATVGLQPVLDRIQKFGEDNFTVPGKQKNLSGKTIGVPMGPVAEKGLGNIQALQDTLKQVASTNPETGALEIPATSLRRLRQYFDSVTESAGRYEGRNLDDATTGAAHGAAADAIREELGKEYPDINSLNKEYSFWKDVHRVVGDTLLRRQGQAKPLSVQMAKTAATATGLASGGVHGAIIGRALAGGLERLVGSPAWRTVSAVAKDRLADAIAGGNKAKIADQVASIASSAPAPAGGHPLDLRSLRQQIPPEGAEAQASAPSVSQPLTAEPESANTQELPTEQLHQPVDLLAQTQELPQEQQPHPIFPLTSALADQMAKNLESQVPPAISPTLPANSPTSPTVPPTLENLSSPQQNPDTLKPNGREAAVSGPEAAERPLPAQTPPSAIEVAPQAAEGSPPKVSGAVTTIKIPGSNTSYPARYSVRELSDLNPSHSGITFERNPRFSYENDRDYTKSVNQERVLNSSSPGNFDPEYMINTDPTNGNGPPVIEPDGHVLGGNNRTMIMHRVYEMNPRGAAAYRQSLIDKAHQFGIDPKQIDGMKFPVLVRELDPADTFNRQRAITDFNKTGTAKLTPAEQATADARNVTPEVAKYISGAVESEGADATLTDVLNGSRGRSIINHLVDSGVFTPQEKPYLIDSKTGAITAAGKDRISKMFLGSVFRDSDQMYRTPPALRNKLERVIAPMLSVSEKSGWDITPRVRSAIDLIEYANSHGISNLKDAVKQESLFGKAEDIPKETLDLAMAIKSLTPNELAKRFKRYASDSEPSMFGEVKPHEAFEQHFGGE